MKKGLVLTCVFSMVLAGSVLSACNKISETSEDFTPQHKTEHETVNVEKGVFPQTLERDVTYVQKEKDGRWEEESATVTKWELGDTSVLEGTVWVVTVSDAKALAPELDDSFKDVEASLYFNFAGSLGEVKATAGNPSEKDSKIDVDFTSKGDVFFIAGGERFPINEVDLLGAEVYMDGSAKLKMDYGEGPQDISLPYTARKIDWEEYMTTKSDTYIRGVSFKDLPTFNVTSETLDNWMWDIKISKTMNGQNVNPQLSWEAVDGASSYVVIMIDGAWLHMDYFTTETSLAEGAIDSDLRSVVGKQYVGPYPPEGSTHTYSVFVFALRGEAGSVPLNFDKGGNSINDIFTGLDTDKDGNTGNVLSYGRLDGNYTQKWS